jgi:DNA-binding Lrp family transcriptional regulator
MSNITLDEKDFEILRILQKDAKTTAKAISRKISSPITTVYSRINRMEEAGIISSYKTVLDPYKLGKPTTAFILTNFTYRTPGVEEPLDQHSVAKEIAGFKEVQEIHIISGDWDLIIKLKAANVADVGNFVVNKLRTVRGVAKTLTCMVFESMKETSDLHI